MTNNFRALCADLIEAVLSDDSHIDCTEIARRARAALAAEADGPAVPESREPASVVGEPSDKELLKLARAELNNSPNWEEPEYDANNPFPYEAPGVAWVNFARAVLARWGHQPAPPAEGEVAEVTAWLRAYRDEEFGPLSDDPDARWITRAAELLQRQAQQTLPQGLIPMEYVDADSSARIVSEPSEDGPGGCWVVRDSRHVNPCTEFPTAEAAWDALQRAQSLPLPEVGE